MIHVKKVTHLYSHHVLSDLGQEEMRGGDLRNSRVWEVYEDGQFMFFFGLKIESLIGPKIVWFAAGQSLSRMSYGGWRTLLRTMSRLRGRLTAYVREDLRHACRMARFFGFEAVGQTLNYKVYERWQP